MPQLGLIPLISLITSAAAAAEGGARLAGVGQPGPHAGDAAVRQQQMLQAQQEATAKQKAIQATIANAQEQGGGALNAPSLVDLASVIAGLPGEGSTNVGKGALSSYLGTPPAGTSSSGTPDTMVSATYGLSGSQG